MSARLDAGGTASLAGYSRYAGGTAVDGGTEGGWRRLGEWGGGIRAEGGHGGCLRGRGGLRWRRRGGAHRGETTARAVGRAEVAGERVALGRVLLEGGKER